jgi:hypothetical protein
MVALQPKPAQQRLLQIKARQEAEGRPVRIIVLKARKEGISTIVQGLMVKRITTRRNHKALVIAHDGKTATELFEAGELARRVLGEVLHGAFAAVRRRECETHGALGEEELADAYRWRY